LPLEDAMPALVAEQNGYFVQENIDVEIVRFQSAVEQESAIQSGQLDGIVNDLIVATLLKESGQNIKVTSIALGSTPEEGKFAVVATPKSGIKTLEDLKGKKIGIANNTIIEYVTDGMLEDGGIDPSLVNKVSVPKIPVRMEMLFSNQVDAIVVPDPLLTFAEFKGARIVAQDTKRNLSQSVVLFNQKTMDEKKGAVEAFFRAYAKAVDDLNNHPADYKQLMIANVNIPEQIAKDYQIQRYPKPQLPAEDDINNVLKWMTKKGLLKTDLKYQDLVEKIQF
ncbi:MAG: MetQ/NlpA family ABC transporter substrate-binding protein, partial [Desulfotomaculaceae bacterium]|nr:MetQ/NlpA family ABC transporter substrate-binding protein [Desulfotomaculaceae bacterium]